MVVLGSRPAGGGGRRSLSSKPPARPGQPFSPVLPTSSLHLCTECLPMPGTVAIEADRACPRGADGRCLGAFISPGAR